ncbi:MAG: tRNA (N6-threonylcarbamoyladenosine(37)-N6)-methyltransferase TrmO [Clostridiales bacterium]|nr:tRNA (N6-threonylcarbamoyladenosine(37)-N6)-methyltransferase TrmO [Clostridiales bacterium]
MQNKNTGALPEFNIIARIHSDFKSKFGVPRQSGIVDSLEAKIVFEPEYRDPNALRGIEGWSHLWLIWYFSEAVKKGSTDWSPTVRPPRLGGNTRVGVFATRSPFRPNPIGLSSVKLLRVENEGELGMVLYVSGADLMDGTPILDIKPYLAYTDSHADALSGFAGEVFGAKLCVEFPDELLACLPESKREAAVELLAEDPRPAIHDDPEREYGFVFAGCEIKFRVDGARLIVTEVEVDF